eukprot:8715953-Alexandrium_andersonii.AAC.1
MVTSSELHNALLRACRRVFSTKYTLECCARAKEMPVTAVQPARGQPPLRSVHASRKMRA